MLTQLDPVNNENELSELTQAEVLSMIRLDDPINDLLIQKYLELVSASFSATEAFAIIAYVDTPDVLDC